MSTYFNCTPEQKKDLLNNMIRAKICRFKAYERLEIYSEVSNWLFTIISLNLIIINLIYKYDILKVSNESFFNFFQVSLSIIILVIFTVISSSNFKIKALRFHQCGMEISSEIRKLETISLNKMNEKAIDRLKRIQNEYTSILKRYDNHKQIDYLVYIRENQKDLSQNDLLFLKLKINFYQFFNYLPHIILFFITFFGTYFCFIW
ncbi:SLATT domain-containing protein [Aliarcobacter butzleri]|uniref:SLATT domain-containing protein n=1 Tax=Aliarcobacter butzleri TaxID=28197 RepID=UPI003AF47A9E